MSKLMTKNVNYSGALLCIRSGGVCFLSEEGEWYPCSNHCIDCQTSKCENHMDEEDTDSNSKDTDSKDTAIRPIVIDGVTLKPFLSTDVFQRRGNNIFKLGKCLKCMGNWMVKEGKKISCMDCNMCDLDDNVYCTIHNSCFQEREITNWGV